MDTGIGYTWGIYFWYLLPREKTLYMFDTFVFHALQYILENTLILQITKILSIIVLAFSELI
jgi:hypothetical protein